MRKYQSYCSFPSPHISATKERTVEDIVAFLQENPDGLDVILRDIGLSDEKFMRIISLLRKVGRISGGFDSEWNIARIKRQLSDETSFVELVGKLLHDGKRDQELFAYIPRFYLGKLNYREIRTLPHALRKVRYKESTIGTYGARKGHRVEGKIKDSLEAIKAKYGIGYEKGRSRFINVDIDFAIPTLEDPWVIIMSSFQETTSRRDLERLVAQCHYFINLQNLDMIEAIILAHVPQSYISK